jgi:uncharacterized delta-60 repeat protein
VAMTTVTLSVEAVGAPPIAYQWLKNGDPLVDGGTLSGSLTPTLTLSNLSGGDTGPYSVVVSNISGSLLSQTAYVAVLDAAITNQPASRTNNALTTATFAVGTVSTAPLTYQWLKNGTNLSDGENVAGSTTSALSLSSVLAADGGAYSVLVSNIYGCVTSATAILTVVDPVITSQPASQTICLGQAATLSVGAVGTLPLGYQWRKDGVPLAAATLPILVVSNAQPSDIATYDVVVTNAAGSAVSSGAKLTLNEITCDSFDPGIGGGNRLYVAALAIQPDGKILAGGCFSALCGQPRSSLARLSADGALDPLFSASTDGTVSALVIQPDGKIVVGGSFASLSGQSRANLGRLNADGSLDTAFAPTSYEVSALAVQTDGKILAGAGSTLRRFNVNGTLDKHVQHDF